jgi:hypothetical protein
MNPFNWTQLIRVRERQKVTALETVARDRQASDRCAAATQQARQGLDDLKEAKCALWQSTAGAMTQAGGSVAQLRQAGAWSQALNGRIAQAAQQLQQAREQEQQRQAVLEASRAQLRRVQGELEKAQRIEAQQAREARRQCERREEDRTEDAGVQGWARTQAGRRA